MKTVRSSTHNKMKLRRRLTLPKVELPNKNYCTEDLFLAPGGRRAFGMWVTRMWYVDARKPYTGCTVGRSLHLPGGFAAMTGKANHERSC